MRMLSFVVVVLALGRLVVASPLESGERVMVVGNSLAERIAQSGYLEALIHASHPDGRIVVRQFPWSADEAVLRPREMNVPTTLSHVESFDPTVIIAFFGQPESDRDDQARFDADLRTFLNEVASRPGADGEAARVIFISPIRHEDLGETFTDGLDLEARRASQGTITDTMRAVATEGGHGFVDLFAFTSSFQGRPLTVNGIHPSERGCAVLVHEIGRQLGWLSGELDLTGEPSSAASALRRTVCDKHWLERLLYRPTNTEYVFGRRHEPFGIVNFPPEMDQLRRMIDARDEAMWASEKPDPEAVFHDLGTSEITMWEQTPSRQRLPEDDWTPDAVEAKGTETSLGSLEILSPDEFIPSFTVPDEYVIECFASEQDFPALSSPLAMTFDEKGRLWVMCATTYPHLLPGDRPRCTIQVLEDTDGDGKADKAWAYAEGLYIPTGFAIDTDAVYVGQAPDLLKLTDTDGDERADRWEVVASGFGMPDSHHQVSAFEWDPTGAFFFHEGVFTKSNVETPWGTRRTRDAAVWRFDPRTTRLDVVAHTGHANPWGHVFGDYGESLMADASGGDNYVFSHLAMPYVYPNKPGRPARFLNRGRPTAGCELISSRHFPEDVQESFLVNQCIGFHGTRWDRLTDSGSTYTTESMPMDMISSTDTNFRPVAMEIGPDGTLYVLDWCNPIIGHMQYSVRDPRRDASHGRIWRVRHASRALVEAPDIAGATTEDLLDLLRIPERNTRQHVRRRLQKTDPLELFPAIVTWRASWSEADPLRDRLLLEILWMHMAHGRVDLNLVTELMDASTPGARAGAVRTLRLWLMANVVDRASVLPLLDRGANDDNMKVRLETVLASGYLGGYEGAALLDIVSQNEMDEPLSIVVKEVLAYIARDGEIESDLVVRFRYERMNADELAAVAIDPVSAPVVLSRRDQAIERRLQALATMAGDDSRQKVLVDALGGARTSDACASYVEVLDELDDVDPAPLGTLASSDAVGASHAGAWLARHGHALPDDVMQDPDRVVKVVSRLEMGAPVELLDVVREGVQSGRVDAARGIDEVVKHTPERAEVFAWLAGLVDGASAHFGDWSDAHERGVVALAAMHAIPDWPSGFGDYRIEPASPEKLAAGAELFHDEALGCARCHGHDGMGLEGFPPLARSPWVLGDPKRAASIVIHGMTGPLDLGGKGRFDSTMAPLGPNLTDDQIAAVLTFVRQSFGNHASEVYAHEITMERQREPSSGLFLTTAEILEAYPLRAEGLLGPWQAPRQAGPAIVTPFVLAAIVMVVIVAVGVTVLVWGANRLSS